MERAQAVAGKVDTPRAKADRLAIVSNRARLDAFGCFTPEGMAELRKGGSPTITKGPDAGRGVALDHVLPVKVAPELAAKLFNLQAISDRENLAKAAKIGRREIGLARDWHGAGLLSADGLAAVEKAAGK